MMTYEGPYDVVEERVTDGKRIAGLLASELDGREDGDLARIEVANADPDVEPAVDGARAYDVLADGDPLASVHVHPERARIDFAAGRGDPLDTAYEAADGAGLRVRRAPAPTTMVFVESGAEVKRAVRVVGAVL